MDNCLGCMFNNIRKNYYWVGDKYHDTMIFKKKI